MNYAVKLIYSSSNTKRWYLLCRNRSFCWLYNIVFS